MNDIYVNIDNISKSYGNVRALNNINIGIRKAEIFGLIGPDGSGKSTLIRILNTLILPDSGSAHIGDLDIIKDFKSSDKLSDTCREHSHFMKILR